MAFMIDTSREEIVDQLSLEDCSGVAAVTSKEINLSSDLNVCDHQAGVLVDGEQPMFMVTSGTGRIKQLPEAQSSYEHSVQYHWDNHLYKF